MNGEEEDNFIKYINSSLKVKDRIGKGTFGSVYEVAHATYKRRLAMKVEFKSTETERASLLREARVLYALRGKTGFAHVKEFKVLDTFSYMVMDMLGPSLMTLQTVCFGRFSLKTGIVLMCQLLDRLEDLHEKGYIHRDIKPDNFSMGDDTSSDTVFLIDFGISCAYKNKLGRLTTH